MKMAIFTCKQVCTTCTCIDVHAVHGLVTMTKVHMMEGLNTHDFYDSACVYKT